MTIKSKIISLIVSVIIFIIFTGIVYRAFEVKKLNRLENYIRQIERIQSIPTIEV